ncbi:hypothetical protein NP493_1336g00012 [Ridgeia piscesae]|uniref:Reverse transcriptase domain-containing protein n=1 Tax=Ridgeia piscesae TaxID=27915 RepID=A0AAD9K7Y7_RIDPI|nr:hypothetical protein NP493_1336g00012 [Ridgeia piscesae]
MGTEEDLEKAYDMVTMDLVYWSENETVLVKLVKLVEATYHGASTVVRTTHGRTDEFPIKVGLHQGSGLSRFLFIVVLDVSSEEFRCGLPCELLFTDDLVAVVTDTKEEMQRRWLGLGDGTEATSLRKISRTTTTGTQYLVPARTRTRTRTRAMTHLRVILVLCLLALLAASLAADPAQTEQDDDDLGSKDELGVATLSRQKRHVICGTLID